MIEKDIENIIAKYPNEFFPKEDFKIISQQYILDGKRIDILFEDKHKRKIIIEVKRGILTREATGQIVEYYGLLKTKYPKDFIELILIANTIPKERKLFLEQIGIDCLEISYYKILEIAQKYNFPISNNNKKIFNYDNIELIDNNIIETPEKVWIFQGNPEYYDVFNALLDKNLSTIHWTVNQHKNDIKQGHIGIIWISGKDSGIYALTKIITDPIMTEEYPEEIKYWIDNKREEKIRFRARMVITKRFVENPLFRARIKEIKGLENLSILMNPQGTNFHVTLDEWEIINHELKIQQHNN